MFAHVFLPLKLSDSYLYSVPTEFSEEVAVGMRCVVQFGTKRFYVGIIASLTNDSSQARGKRIKPILSLPDKYPIVTLEEIELWKWAAHYYMATPGDFLRAAIPITLIPQSETLVYLHLERAEVELPPEQAEVVERLRTICKRKIRFDLLLSTVIGARRIKIFEALLERGILSVEEDIHKASNTIGTRCVGFTKAYRTDEAIALLMDELRRKPARLRLIQQLIALQEEENLGFDGWIPERVLTRSKEAPRQALRHLVTDNILEVIYHSVVQHKGESFCYDSIELSLPHNKPTLYIAPDYRREMSYLGRHIQSTISKGKRVLLLLPQSTNVDGALEEIQMQLGVQGVTTYLYTSTLPSRERSALRYRLLETEEPMLIVGSRTASLLPAHLWGLIIVAEEQDSFYKQQEPTPRYHARDLLIVRAHKIGIPILLSSVTPSAESFYNAMQGKYHCINASEPIPKASLEMVDLQYERSTQRLQYGKLFTHPLKEAITQTLAKGDKVLILSAHRGFAPYVFCNRCRESLKCIHCSVSLTYHQKRRALICHYCGYMLPFPTQCPKCTHMGDMIAVDTLELKGFGSERVEEELLSLHPDVSITRVDIDTFRTKEQKKRLRESLERAEASIYVGTQMLRHFLPIKGVRLIGVTQLDQMLSISNFRTDEQVFDLLYQLMAKYPKACLLLQTSDPERPLLTLLHEPQKREGEYTSSYTLFMQQLLEERRLTHFPPYVRLINIIVKATQEGDAVLVAQHLSSSLQAHTSFFSSVSIPMKPYVSRVRLKYIRQITLRLDPKASSVGVRTLLKETITALEKQLLQARRVTILFDVDPQG